MTVGLLLQHRMRYLDEVNHLLSHSKMLSFPGVLKLQPREVGKQLSVFAVDLLQPSELGRWLSLDCDAC